MCITIQVNVSGLGHFQPKPLSRTSGWGSVPSWTCRPVEFGRVQ